MDDVPLQEIGAFLTQNPPQLTDILAVTCELYRVLPDAISERTNVRASAAREMFLYCAHNWAGKTITHAARLVGIYEHEGSRRLSYFRDRLKDNQVLRDDLGLAAIRLTDAVLRRRRACLSP